MFYLVHTVINPCIYDEYTEWQETEHIPWLLGVPGYQRMIRLQSITDSNAYLNVWNVKDKATFECNIKQQVSNSPWSVRLRKFRSTDIHFYECLEDHHALDTNDVSGLGCLFLSPPINNKSVYDYCVTADGHFDWTYLTETNHQTELILIVSNLAMQEKIIAQLEPLGLPEDSVKRYKLLPVPNAQEPFHNSLAKNVWPISK